MNTLALDLATKTGWAVHYDSDGTPIVSGVQDFSLLRGESPGMLFVRFRARLIQMLENNSVGLVVYEQAHHRGGAATRIGVGLVTHMEAICAEREIEYTPVHSATLKKFATGSGKASKKEMLDKAKIEWPDQGIEGDDQADALWLLEWARAQGLVVVREEKADG